MLAYVEGEGCRLRSAFLCVAQPRRRCGRAKAAILRPAAHLYVHVATPPALLDHMHRNTAKHERALTTQFAREFACVSLRLVGSLWASRLHLDTVVGYSADGLLDHTVAKQICRLNARCALRQPVAAAVAKQRSPMNATRPHEARKRPASPQLSRVTATRAIRRPHIKQERQP